MFCSQCGQQIGTDSRFCKFCGAPQEPVQQSTSAPVYLPPTTTPAPHHNNDQEQTIKASGIHPLRLGPKNALSNRQIIVTNRRVIFREGLIGKAERAIPLSRVTDVSVKYSMAGRVAGYGTVVVQSAGSSEAEIVAEDIKDPEGVKNAILSQIR
jgi:hypothetical protein